MNYKLIIYYYESITNNMHILGGIPKIWSKPKPDFKDV